MDVFQVENPDGKYARDMQEVTTLIPMESRQTGTRRPWLQLK
jgi:hypothetical protein